MEILTIQEAADFLRMNRSQIYDMTRARAKARMPIPIPLIRVNGNIRFKRSSLETWINQLEEYERTGRLPGSTSR